RKIESNELHDNVIITGQQDHSLMPFYLALCDILTAPFSEKGKRWSYGFSPLKIFEYLAMGKPIIATAIPWIEEIIDKNIGRIIPPKDPTTMANSIIELLENPKLREKMGEKSRQKALKDYDWNVIGRQLFKVYSNLLEGPT
ncbi:glycosyltransferase, partial [Candidatus Heimdallarchaeota archaeon]